MGPNDIFSSFLYGDKELRGEEHFMKLRKSSIFAIAAAVGLSMVPPFCLSAQAQDSTSHLTLRSVETNIHILPTPSDAAALVRPFDDGAGPLSYHSGGVIMPTVTTFAIFWNPPKLQDGTPTSIPAHYQTVIKNMLADYSGHGLGSNNTQYYQTVGSTTTYIQNVGKFGGFFVDTALYPPSGCTDPATPSGCITDAQIQTEIKKVMKKKLWKPGITNMYLLFTAPGEGSCTAFGCAYTMYCAYHGFVSSGTPIIYANEPYGEASVCQVPGAPSPNGDIPADTAATAASHELTEAITDPMLNAWFASDGEEIGDICAYDYGSVTWDGGFANQMWNGNFYLLQQQYDNHALACVQAGP
jgi:hypothetical protein